jgi:hypothetical protein
MSTMTRSSWHEIRTKFLKGAAEYPDLAACWESRQRTWTFRHSPTGEYATVPDPKAERFFKETARTAGTFLEPSGDVAPWHAWLEHMRTKKRGFKRSLKPRTWSETKMLMEAESLIDTSRVPLSQDGGIAHVFEASADFCADLDLQNEIHSSDPISEPSGNDRPSSTASRQRSEHTRIDMPKSERSEDHLSVEDEARKLNIGLINKWMKDEGHSNGDLADILRVSVRTVSSLRNNGDYHGQEAVTKLANRMDRDVEDLYLP